MELELVRKYYPDGTNGELYANGTIQCYTIELPWLNNQPRVSCIPEGRYPLKKRYSPKFGDHLLVDGVAGRSGILIHPANNALKELKGCIAPVSRLSGEGKGILSRVAFGWIMSLLQEALEREEPIFLTIKCYVHETTGKDTTTHTAVL